MSKVLPAASAWSVGPFPVLATDAAEADDEEEGNAEK
jgi:hypothetical protein